MRSAVEARPERIPDRGKWGSSQQRAKDEKFLVVYELLDKQSAVAVRPWHKKLV